MDVGVGRLKGADALGDEALTLRDFLLLWDWLDKL